jgi:hypothetical protein
MVRWVGLYRLPWCLEEQECVLLSQRAETVHGFYLGCSNLGGVSVD